MIKVDNPLLSLFQAACQMSTRQVKNKYKGVGILVEVIKGELRHSCSRCFRYVADTRCKRNHENVCGVKKRFDAVNDVLTLRIGKTLHC